MKIPQTLGEAGVSRTEYERMREHIVESALRDACTATNPRKPDANAIRTILRGIERF
jgi:alcohol dehydrogenase class IV